MKKIYIIITLAVLLFVSCKTKNEVKKDFYGKWYSNVEFTCDDKSFNKAVIEFCEDEKAYLNYSGPDGDKWEMPRECRWWIGKDRVAADWKKDTKFFLFIERSDTLLDYCRQCFNCTGSFYEIVDMPDTTIYIIDQMDDNTIVINLEQSGELTSNDMFFSKFVCYFCPASTGLYR